MKARFLFFALACAVGLYGQRKFNWQNYCFQNPTAPFCMGHEDAIKHTRRGNTAAPKTGVGSALTSASGSTAPAPAVTGGID